MANQITTRLVYAVSDTNNGVLNDSVLTQQINESAVSTSVSKITLPGTSFIVEMGDLLEASEVAIIDGLVAAHVGADFDVLPISEQSNNETSDDTGDEVVKVSLFTGILAEGSYNISWHMEHATTIITGTTGSRAALYARKNSRDFIEYSQDANGENQFKLFSSSVILSANPGDSYEFELRHERIGASGNASRAQRARLHFNQIG